MILIFIIFYLGIILVNLSWIVFLLLLGSKIFGFISYAWFSFSSLSIIGTPLLLLFSGFGLMIISYFITKMKGYKNVSNS